MKYFNKSMNIPDDLIVNMHSSKFMDIVHKYKNVENGYEILKTHLKDL